MRTFEFDWHAERGLSRTGEADFQPDLVLFFGERTAIGRGACNGVTACVGGRAPVLTNFPISERSAQVS
jgi:hypothetical protein